MSKSMNVDNSKFKNKRGAFLTNACFWEFRADGYEPMYTLKEKDLVVDGVTYPSLKRLYLEERDLLEINFAKKYLYSYRHWKQMCGNKQLLPHIEDWREELEITIRSDGLKALIGTAIDEGAKGTAAQKFLVDRGWLTKQEAKKDTTKEQTKEEASTDLENFLQRIK